MATTEPPTRQTRQSVDPTLRDLPTDPRRVRAFAIFFKNYMSISTIVIAALPAPITFFKLIPTYEAHRYLLSVYAPQFCFLLLGFIFFSRHTLGRRLFYPDSLAPYAMPDSLGVRRWWSFRVSGLVSYAPMLLLVASFLAAIGYMHTLEDSVWVAKAERLMVSEVRFRLLPENAGAGNPGRIPVADPRNTISEIRDLVIRYDRTLGLTAGGPLRGLSASILLGSPAEKTATWEHLRKELSFEEIPLSLTLKWRYLLIFLTAEAAFILMAIKEYLQDVLQISDVELIRPQPAKP